MNVIINLSEVESEILLNIIDYTLTVNNFCENSLGILSDCRIKIESKCEIFTDEEIKHMNNAIDSYRISRKIEKDFLSNINSVTK